MFCDNMHSNTYTQKGSALYYTIALTSVLLAIGLGVSVIVVSELRMLRVAGDSVFAFGAADAGIEEVLYIDRVHCSTISLPIDPGDNDRFLDELLGCFIAEVPSGLRPPLGSGAQYELFMKCPAGTNTSAVPNCLNLVEDTCLQGSAVKNYCARSEGRFQAPGNPYALREVKISR